MRRQGYDGVVLAAPTSVPYARYSNETAHWWIARALREMLGEAGIAPVELDGFSVSSFSLAPDTPVGLTQHLGLSPRWLDTVPTGGASG
ncbi:MAG TPA: thiolase family protein, partial [Sulfitobacter sp.]|nr:thiolase family protein [Sulfitobacter sp.]